MPAWLERGLRFCGSFAMVVAIAVLYVQTAYLQTTEPRPASGDLNSDNARDTPNLRSPKSSLLLLIDVSGSMGDQIGSGRPEIKIVAAKQAASAAVQQAVQGGTVEVAVLAFEGDCARPVTRYADFTSDSAVLERFIASLQPGGQTPMAPALLYANRFMNNEGDPSARDRMIVLLADGQNNCGSISDALVELRASGVIFRHETVGFGIEPNSPAAQDLRDIATASGGTYHHAADATQLGDLFAEFVDTLTVIDLLGTFRQRGKTTTAANRSALPPLVTHQTPSPRTTIQMTDLLGTFTSTVGTHSPATTATITSAEIREGAHQLDTTAVTQERHPEVTATPGFRDCLLSLRSNSYYIVNKGGIKVDTSWQAQVGAPGARGELKQMSFRFEVHYRGKFMWAPGGETRTDRQEVLSTHNFRETAVTLWDQVILSKIVEEVLSVRIVPGSLSCRW